MKLVHGACPHDCPDTCAWQVSVDNNGRAVGLQGNADHPFTRGALCSKLKRYTERVYSKERILHPLRRTGAKGSGEFKQISWEEAFGEVVDQLQQTVTEHGPLAAMPCNFAGTIGLLHRYAGDQFFSRLGATELDRQICGNVAFNAVAATNGPGRNMLPDDLAHSRMIVIWGSNTVATNVHLWSGPIKAARKQGAKIVVIDPVKTPTAAHADQHIQIRPATDAALALGMMHVIIRDELHDAAYIEAHTLGFDQLSERVKQYPPERVEEITGIDAATIEQLARDYATTKPAALRLLVGMERYSNGAEGFRAVACLPALTGAWRDLGGGICQFTSDIFFDAVDYSVILAPEDAPPPERVLHLSQLGKTLTDATMDPPIHWMLVYNLNPVVTLPNQNLIIEGLKREDLFTVVHEQFMTDTARYADIILPATTQYEHWELMPSWGQTYLAINPPAIEPLGESVSNTELFRQLSAAMGFHEAHLLRSDEARIRKLLDSGSEMTAGISFESLLETGWAKLNLPDNYRPHVNGDFATPSGKVEFYAASLDERGLDPLPNYTPINDEPGQAELPLRLVSAKTAHFLNSEYVNLPHKGTANHVPELHINPTDAAARNIQNGDEVLITNPLGEVAVRALVSHDTGSGVVYLPFNWWTTSTLNGSSANALTPDGLSDYGIGSNAFDARVEVRKVNAGA